MSTLRHAVLDALRHGEVERFTLDPDVDLDHALVTALAGPAPTDELADVLRLIVALEQSLGSPTAAEALRVWLRRSPGARTILGHIFGAARGLDAARAFAEREGRSGAARAGMYGADAPSGAFAVRRWLDPRASSTVAERARATRPASNVNAARPAAASGARTTSTGGATRAPAGRVTRTA